MDIVTTNSIYSARSRNRPSLVDRLCWRCGLEAHSRMTLRNALETC